MAYLLHCIGYVLLNDAGERLMGSRVCRDLEEAYNYMAAIGASRSSTYWTPRPLAEKDATAQDMYEAGLGPQPRVKFG